MARIFLIGDIHLGLGYTAKDNSLTNYYKWLKIHKQYFDEFLFPLLEREIESDSHIVLLGDLFDNRDVVTIDSHNYAFNTILKLANLAPTHILIGNHDMWNKSSAEVNSLKSFRFIPNVHIYDTPKKVIIDDLKILFLPYINNSAEQIKIMQDNVDCHYLFCHSDLNGARMHLTSVANRNMDKIDISEFSNFIKVFSGHIHIYQKNKNFTFVGNVFEMDRNDFENNKGIIILDTVDGSETFIENGVSPKFKKVLVISEKDVDNLVNLDFNDHIDLSISSSLLVNNKKVSRKLDAILEKGRFASVNHVNDIIMGDDTDIKVDDVKIDQSYEDIIGEYINVQNYSSDKIKDGILTEFKNIIETYDKTYKK